jgi:dUTP pyrophosphatase
MNTVGVQIKTHFVNDKMKIPEYATAGAAGFDLQANIKDVAVLLPHKQHAIPTGVWVAIPPGWEMQIRSKSGLAYHEGIFILNSPGTIDSDYRGEIFCIMGNITANTWEFNPGDKLGQGVICESHRVRWEEVTELPETDRGEGAFGSTGR